MPEPSHRRRLLILAICCMSLLIVSLDNTALNVALPALQSDLHASTSGLQWTIDAYTLVLASLLMLAGSTADRIGRKRVFMAGLVVFTIGSALCSLAPDLNSLIVFRMVQAVGGSMLNPVAMSIITNTFTNPRERARAIGVWGAVVGISMAAGPLIGGLLVETVGWRAIFWVNLPVGLAALLLTLRFVPESRAAKARRADPVGQVLVMLLFGSLTYAIIEAPTAPAAEVLVFGGLAMAALVGLLVHEPRRAEPLIDLRFFRSAPFSGATVIAVSAFAALGGFLFLSTLYLQNVRGLDALHAGLWMLPMAALCFVCAPVAGRVVGNRGPRLPLLIAGASMTASGILFAAFEAESSDATLVLGYILFGLGFGFVNAPITNTGGVRHAPRPGGRRRRRGLHQPPARPGARRRRDRRGPRLRHRHGRLPHRLRHRGPPRLVDRGRLRRPGPPGGPPDDGHLGPYDGGPYGGVAGDPGDAGVRPGRGVVAIAPD
ncbi:EmrB/QacA subfamily drug resistance transporter [Streptomyces tendae]